MGLGVGGDAAASPVPCRDALPGVWLTSAATLAVWLSVWRRMWPTPRPPYPLGLTLVYCDGLERAGEQVRLTRRARVELGWDHRAFIGGPIEDPRIGGRHASLIESDGRWRVVDRGGKAGTFVEGRRVKEHLLSPGEVIRLGATFIVFGYVQERPGSLMINGVGAAMAEVEARVRALAAEEGPVVLLGELGTGKELIAHELHRLSGRSGELIRIDGADPASEVLADALFGAEGGGGALDRPGTVFIESLASMPLALQARLAEHLERPRSVARVVVAVEREAELDEQARCDAGLVARLGMRRVRLPSLRERREDLGVLTRVLLGRYGAGLDVTAELMDALVTSPWPRNIRGLVEVLGTAWRGQPGVRRLALTAPVREAFANQDHTTERSFVRPLPTGS